MHPTGKDPFSRKVAAVVGQWVELHQLHLQQRTRSLLKEYFTDAAASGETKAGNFKALQGNQPQGAPAPCCSAAAWCRHPDPNGQGTGTPLTLPAGAPCPKRSQGGPVLALSLWSSRGTQPAAPMTSLVAAELHMCSQSLVLQTPACRPQQAMGSTPAGCRRPGSSSSERTAAWPGAWESRPPAALTPDPGCKTRSPPGSDPASSFLFLDLSF